MLFYIQQCWICGKILGDTDLCQLFPMYIADPHEQLITDVTAIFKDLQKAVDNVGPCPTSELESFHSQLNRNAPKMEGFSYCGMLSMCEMCYICF